MRGVQICRVIGLDGPFPLASPIPAGDIDDADCARIPRLAVEAGAGHSAGGPRGCGGRSGVPARLAAPSRAAVGTTRQALEARGDAMAPAFFGGDAVLMERGSAEPKRSREAVAWTEGGLVIERLERLGAGWLLSSDNPGDCPPTMLAARARIVGCVGWRGAWAERPWLARGSRAWRGALSRA